MKQIISKADHANALKLFSESWKYIDREIYFSLRSKLEQNYNSDKLLSTQEGRSELWEICVELINAAFGSVSTIQLLRIIKSCQSMEGISDVERTDFGTLYQVAEQIETECDNYKLLALKSDFFKILRNDEMRLQLFFDELSSKTSKASEIFKIRLLLDDICNETYSFNEALENMRMIIRCRQHSIDVFTRLLESKFSDSEEYQELIYLYLSENADKGKFRNKLIDSDFSYTAKLRIFKKLGMPVDLPKEFIKEIIKFNSILDRKTILEKMKCTSNWDDEFQLELAICYFSTNELRKSEYLLDDLIIRNAFVKRAFVLKGDIYKKEAHFKKALFSYQKALEHEKLDKKYILNKIIEAYACNKYYVKASQLYEKTHEGELSRRDFRTVYSWIGCEFITTNFLTKCLENVSINKLRNELSFDNDYFYQWIIDETKSVDNNGVVRLGLLTLYKQIDSLKQKLRLDTSTYNSVYHYSSLESITCLASFRDQTASRFHLSNVAYMNDPAEGDAFIDVLDSFSLLSQVKQLKSLLYGKESFTYRKTYLSSFSLRGDFLPMWVQYANKGHGCCYEIPSKLFGKRDRSLERQAMKGKTKLDIERTDAPVLYKVFYYDRKHITDEDQKIIDSCKVISNTLLSLKSYLSRKSIQSIITGMLDEVRYLFKSSDYKTEEEVRIIQTDYDNTSKLTDKKATPDAPPRLYLDLNFDLKFSEIMFGPKVTNIKEWAAYLGNCSNVEKISQSSIKFQ
jgi:hypothetical protein